MRDTYKVQWDGGQMVEVTSTVKDLIAALDLLEDGQSTNQVALTTRLIHLALQRHGHELPPYDDWLDVLDFYELSAKPSNGEGPTRRGRSASGPSSSPASRAPTGARGSKRTTAPSKLPSNS